MNPRIESIVSKNTVRIKSNHTVIGTGIIIEIDAEHFGLLCLKHCFTDSQNLLLNDLKFEIWDKNQGSFKSEAIEFSLEEQYLNPSKDEEVLLIPITKKGLESEFVFNFHLCLQPPSNHVDFFNYGYPKGTGYTPNSIKCDYNSNEGNIYKFSTNSAYIEHIDGSHMQENTDSFSGSGIWFQEDKKIYLLCLFKGANEGIPLISAMKLKEINSFNKKNSLIFEDFSKPKNEYLKPAISRPGNRIFQLNYQNEYVEFVGREKELKQIESFIEAEDNFKWLKISGKGGSGKNRFLLEVSKIYNKKEWSIKQLDTIEEFNKLVESYIDFNTLILIDYEIIIEKTISINFSLKGLFSKISELNHLSSSKKIRVIFYSRFFDENFKKEANSNPDMKLSEYQDINLGQLTEEEYTKIIKGVFVNEKEKILLSDNQLNQIQKNISHLEIPLYAQLIAWSLIDHRNISEWVEEDLLNYFFDLEFSKSKNKFPANDFENHKNLLGILLMLKKPSFELITTLADSNFIFLPERHNLNKEFIEEFCIENGDKYDHLFPDLFRTFFSLKVTEKILSEKLKFNGKEELHRVFDFLQDRLYKTTKEDGYTTFSLEENDEENLFNHLILCLQSHPGSPATKELAYHVNKLSSNPFLNAPSFVVGVILDVIQSQNETKIDKLRYYEELINLSFPSENYTDQINLCKFYQWNILAHNKIEHYYNLIKTKSEYFIENPNLVINGPTDEEYQRMLSSPDEEIQAYIHKPQKIIKWEGIQLIEAQTIKFILSNVIDIDPLEVNGLKIRIQYLTEICSDLRIYNIYLEYLTLISNNSLEKDKFIKLILNKLLNPSDQVEYINSEFELILGFARASDFFILNKKLTDFLYYYDQVYKKIKRLKNYRAEITAKNEFLRVIYHFINQFEQAGNYFISNKLGKDISEL